MRGAPVTTDPTNDRTGDRTSGAEPGLAPVAGSPVSDADVVVILSKHQDQIDDLTTIVEDLSQQLSAVRSALAGLSRQGSRG